MQRYLPSGDVSLLDGQQHVCDEEVLQRRLRAYLKYVTMTILVVAAVLLGWCYAGGLCGKRPLTVYHAC